jgi:hypothetical protein
MVEALALPVGAWRGTLPIGDPETQLPASAKHLSATTLGDMGRAGEIT